MKKPEGNAWDIFTRVRTYGSALFLIAFIILKGALKIYVSGGIGLVAALIETYICFKNDCKALGILCACSAIFFLILMIICRHLYSA